jgi:hypothetical protein
LEGQKDLSRKRLENEIQFRQIKLLINDSIIEGPIKCSKSWKVKKIYPGRDLKNET